jgi:hypothetical protein
VQSVSQFYRSRTKNLFRGTINYDNWEKKLGEMRDNEAALISKFNVATSITHLGLARKIFGGWK